ncbi:MAG: sigma-54-dependent Fis family transcriptional regulator [Deltaproteobacteria bacterium]|nr:sigma-54-dependent Fis family transcriptional regulator [Deltaproteobacteria bacterium]
MNILIVDDNDENLYFLEALLKGNGHEVRSAVNGAEAFEKLRTGRSDLIISDILMPVMDGFQLCRKVKMEKDLCDIPFIIYTSEYTSSQDEAFAVKIGADRFITKPCEPDELMKVIEEAAADARRRNIVPTPGPLQDEEMLKAHNERLLRKLEQKIVQLEKEIKIRQVVEESLQASERTLKTVFESATDGIVAAEVKTESLVMANKAMGRMLGCSADEVKSLSLADIHPSESLDHIRSQFEKQVRGEISLALDIPVKRRDGSVFFADVNAAPLDLEGRAHLLGIFRDITARKKAEEELRDALYTIKKLKDRLEAENIYLRDEMDLKEGQGDIVGTSDPMKYAMHRVRQVARTKVTVMLTGETGTGKGTFARFLHRESDRRDKPFVNVPCAGLPANLIESELFGREKGAFTGSTARQIGRFEVANGGTIFLDEIGELPVELQAKLLRVIEDEEFERLGSPHTVKVDVRIITSTNRNLEEEIKRGRFRQDLFYRINAFPVTLPPLRYRREDIPLLVEFFADRFTRKLGKRIEKIPKETMTALQDYDWPGNVRELINVIERAVIVSTGAELRLAEELSGPAIGSAQENKAKGKEGAGEPRRGLAEAEREYILSALQETGWRIEGERGAAQLLGLNPSTLRTRMRKLDIRRP